MTIIDSRLVQSVRIPDLIDLLRSNASRADTERRVPQENIDALADAGLFRLIAPARYGGPQTGVRAFLECSAELGRGCGSTAWVMSLINTTMWMVGLYPERAQREIFDADPAALACSVLTPGGTSESADQGQVITGRWPFASGSLHAGWAVLGIGIVDESGVPVGQGLALVPMSELSIEDTWYVAGMRGTGSNTLVAERVFVPEHRILSVTRAIQGLYPTPHRGESLFHSAFVPMLALALAAPQLGLARGAFEAVQNSLAKGKGISQTFYDNAAHASSTQLRIADAAELIDTAELHLFRAADDIDRWAATGTYMPLRERARVRMDTAYVARRAREAVDILLDVHGAGSFAEVNPLQRIWRDLETASRHAIVGSAVAGELYGRALLGVEEQITHLI